MTDQPLPDVAEIRRSLAVLFVPGQVVELRAIGVVTTQNRRPHTVSGYFDNHELLAAEAARVSPHAEGTYVTLNRINPALLARADNRARPVGDKDPTTSDRDVLHRDWLPIDLDPVRPAGISSSDAEREHAFERARLVREHLWAEGWDTPILADSGNGAHLLYRVSLDASDGGHVQHVLHDLAGRFSDAAVKVDEAVFNPARIWKLYGTVARKGDHVPRIGRPHRLARLLEVD